MQAVLSGSTLKFLPYSRKEVQNFLKGLPLNWNVVISIHYPFCLLNIETTAFFNKICQKTFFQNIYISIKNRADLFSDFA